MRWHLRTCAYDFAAYGRNMAAVALVSDKAADSLLPKLTLQSPEPASYAERVAQLAGLLKAYPDPPVFDPQQTLKTAEMLVPALMADLAGEWDGLAAERPIEQATFLEATLAPLLAGCAAMCVVIDDRELAAGCLAAALLLEGITLKEPICYELAAQVEERALQMAEKLQVARGLGFLFEPDEAEPKDHLEI